MSSRPALRRIREIGAVCQWIAAKNPEESVVWDFMLVARACLTKMSAKVFLKKFVLRKVAPVVQNPKESVVRCLNAWSLCVKKEK